MIVALFCACVFISLLPSALIWSKYRFKDRQTLFSFSNVRNFGGHEYVNINIDFWFYNHFTLEHILHHTNLTKEGYICIILKFTVGNSQLEFSCPGPTGP